MELWYIWHPTYGVIYDEGEVIKNGVGMPQPPHERSRGMG